MLQLSWRTPSWRRSWRSCWSPSGPSGGRLWWLSGLSPGPCCRGTGPASCSLSNRAASRGQLLMRMMGRLSLRIINLFIHNSILQCSSYIAGSFTIHKIVFFYFIFTQLHSFIFKQGCTISYHYSISIVKLWHIRYCSTALLFSSFCCQVSCIVNLNNYQ